MFRRRGGLCHRLPTAKSAALRNSYGYRYLLTCNLSPALHSYVKTCLRGLAAINPEIRVDEPLNMRTLPNTKSLARLDLDLCQSALDPRREATAI